MNDAVCYINYWDGPLEGLLRRDGVVFHFLLHDPDDDPRSALYPDPKPGEKFAWRTYDLMDVHLLTEAGTISEEVLVDLPYSEDFPELDMYNDR